MLQYVPQTPVAKLRLQEELLNHIVAQILDAFGLDNYLDPAVVLLDLVIWKLVPPQWLVIVLSGIFNYAQLVCLIQFNLGQVNGTKFANINLSKHE